jgi:two-component system response regulator MprA
LILVEDDRLVRASSGLFFERAGWTVALATDAAEAAACAATPFDVMICDLHLTPARGAEGLAVLAAARQSAPHAVLVLLSGEGTDDLGSVRPDAILQKPVRLPELLELVQDLLRPPRLEARGPRPPS